MSDLRAVGDQRVIYPVISAPLTPIVPAPPQPINHPAGIAVSEENRVQSFPVFGVQNSPYVSRPNAIANGEIATFLSRKMSSLTAEFRINEIYDHFERSVSTYREIRNSKMLTVHDVRRYDAHNKQEADPELLFEAEYFDGKMDDLNVDVWLLQRSCFPDPAGPDVVHAFIRFLGLKRTLSEMNVDDEELHTMRQIVRDEKMAFGIPEGFKLVDVKILQELDCCPLITGLFNHRLALLESGDLVSTSAWDWMTFPLFRDLEHMRVKEVERKWATYAAQLLQSVGKAHLTRSKG